MQPPARRSLRARIDGVDRRQLIQLYQAGETMAALARRFKLSDYSVRLILAEAGARQATPNLTNSQIDLVRRLDHLGLSAEHIHRKTGISASAARLLLAAQSKGAT